MLNLGFSIRGSFNSLEKVLVVNIDIFKSFGTCKLVIGIIIAEQNKNYIPKV